MLYISPNPELMADLCDNPNAWVERSLKSTYNLSQEISNYYLKCTPAKTSPFMQGLNVSFFWDSMIQVNQGISKPKNLAAMLIVGFMMCIT